MPAHKADLDMERVIAYYKTWMYSFSDLGKIFGVSFQTIKNRLEAEGIRVFSENERISRYLDSIQMVQLYEEYGYGLNELAAEYDVSKTFLRRYLVSRGMKIRTLSEQAERNRERAFIYESWLEKVSDVKYYF